MRLQCDGGGKPRPADRARHVDLCGGQGPSRFDDVRGMSWVRVDVAVDPSLKSVP